MSYDIVVVAGGWSVGQYNLEMLCEALRRTASIGVNDSALLLPCEYALSMDRLWTEGRWRQVAQIFNPHRVWIRKGVAKNVTLPDAVHQFEHDGDCIHMSQVSGHLNGSNSGACAVNLAYQLALNTIAINNQKRRVFLLGFDMQDGPNGEKHWYPNYPWRPNGATKPGNFKDWSREFEDIALAFDKIGVRIFNVNHRSAITCLPLLTFQEFCSVLRQECVR